MARRLILPLLILIIITSSLYGQIQLQDKLEELSLSFQWDPWLQEGSIYGGNSSLRFTLSSNVVVLDGKSVGKGNVYRGEGGGLVVDDSFAALLDKHFALDPSGGFRLATIVIDAGHGGKDPGAVGRHRFDGKPFVLNEKDVVLQVARELYLMLSKSYPERNILLTRSDDRYLTLEERTEIANNITLRENEAMVFISIHANASLNSKASGFEVWYLPPDYRRELLDPESLDPELREVAPILNTMLEEEFTIESILLAQLVSQGMESAAGGLSENRGLKEESWFVVRNAKMPSVLVELGFVTHPAEVKLLSDPAYLKKMSQGIYNGVTNFIKLIDQ